MPISTASFTVTRSPVKPCEETECRRPGKDVMRAERITTMTKSRPPGPVGLPLLGSVFPWLRNQPRFLLETYQRFRLDLIPNQRVEATVRTTLQPKYGLLMRPHIQDGHAERSSARVLGD